MKYRLEGFHNRLSKAIRAYKKLGCDSTAYIFNRSFDSCFEMYDGKEIVEELMKAAQKDNILAEGIKRAGDWERWSVAINKENNNSQLDLL